MTDKITLQVNTSGAWRNVLDFEVARKPEVVAAVNALFDAVDHRASFCLVHPNNRREWLGAK